MYSSAWNVVLAHLEGTTQSCLLFSRVIIVTDREIEMGITQHLLMLCYIFPEADSISKIVTYIAQQYNDLKVMCTFTPTSAKRSEAQITEHMHNDPCKQHVFTMKWSAH